MKSIVAIVTVVVLAYLFWPPGGFTDADIASMKASMRAEYTKRGLTVGEIHMVRESKRKMVGFVHVSSGELSADKHCTATMGDDDRNYIWSCE